MCLILIEGTTTLFSLFLGSTSDHVFDEITMAWGINDSDIVFFGFKLPQGNIDGDTTFTFGLEFVQNPSVLERTYLTIIHYILDVPFIDGSLPQ